MASWKWSPRWEKRLLESTFSWSPRGQLPLCTQTPGQQRWAAASPKCLLAPSHFYHQTQSQGHLFPKNKPFHFAKFSFTFKILPKHLHLPTSANCGRQRPGILLQHDLCYCICAFYNFCFPNNIALPQFLNSKNLRNNLSFFKYL